MLWVLFRNVNLSKENHMLTKTFNTLIHAMVTGESFLLTTPAGNTSSQTLPVNMGNNYQSYFISSMLRIPELMKKDSYSAKIINKTGGVSFGSGTAAPTEDDYTIDQVVFTASAGLSATATVTEDGNTFTGLYTIVNNSAESITIAEVGLFGTAPKGTSSYNLYMIDRTLLEEPVTIPSGEVGKVTYTITVP